jgi:hypothetical protein
LALIAIAADWPGRITWVSARNECRLPAAVHEAVPVALANVCPVLCRWMTSRAPDPVSTPVTLEITNFQVRLDSVPTVTATPVVTVSTMIACALALPLDATRTAAGLVADATEMPARYCPGAVLRGTRTVKATCLVLCAPTVTVAGRPVTQHPGPVQARKAPT